MRRLLLVFILLAPLGVQPVGGSPGAEYGGPDGGPPLGAIPEASPDGVLFDWDGTPGGIAGAGRYDDDEFVLTDFPFDDTGADLDGSDGRTDNPLEYYPMTEGANAATSPAGDFAYPGDHNNDADIVEVRFALDEEAWHVLVVLNAMADPSRSAVMVVLENAALDGGSPATLLATPTTATLDGAPVSLAVDTAQNTIEISVPLAVHDPSGRALDVFLGAGLWEDDDWVVLDAQAPPFFDIAFVPGETKDAYWSDEVQSRNLADGSYPSDTFVVDFQRLAEPCTDAICDAEFRPRQPCGFLECLLDEPSRATFTRVFRSAQDLGEGMEIQTLHDQHEGGLGYRFYRSPYQPYSVYLPPTRGEDPAPLVLLLHFLGGNYMSYPITSYDRGLKRWADELGAVVAMPHARGEAGWYEGPAEKDVFEVWRDVARHYNIDRDRVYLAGMSMGGFGTWRLASLYPDQFAAAIVWSGPVTPNSIWPYPIPATVPRENPPMCDAAEPGCGYTLRDIFGNMDNVPTYVVHGGLDELVPSTGAEAWMSEFDREGGSYRYLFYPHRRHETSFPGTTEHWVRDWLSALPARNRDPLRVDYTVVRDLFQPEHGIGYDGAYWVRGLQLAEERASGRMIADVSAGGLDVSIGPHTGADVLGPYVLRGRDRGPTGRSPTQVHVMTSGLREAALDTERLGWLPDEARFVQIVNDEELTLRLAGSFGPGTSITVHGGVIDDWSFEDGDLVLAVPTGGARVGVTPG